MITLTLTEKEAQILKAIFDEQMVIEAIDEHVEEIDEITSEEDAENEMDSLTSLYDKIGSLLK